jgi:hypothetical protein
MEPSSIPKQYGGELDWTWGEMPNLDEPARELLQGLEQDQVDGEKRKDILKGPILFEGDHLKVLGTVDGKERRETIPVPKSQVSSEPEAPAKSTDSEAKTDEPTEIKPEDEKAVDNVAIKVNQLSVDETQTAAAQTAAA